jgi:hypothetical protein
VTRFASAAGTPEIHGATLLERGPRGYAPPSLIGRVCARAPQTPPTPPHDSAARSLASASGPRAPSPRHGAHDVATNGLPIISGALPHEESPRLELHVRPFVDHGLQRAWRSRGGDHGVAITGWRSRGGGDGGWWRRRELRGNERGRMDQRRKRPTSWICPPLPATHHPPPRHPPPDDLSPRRRIVCLSPPPPQPTRHRPPASPSPPQPAPQTAWPTDDAVPLVLAPLARRSRRSLRPRLREADATARVML